MKNEEELYMSNDVKIVLIEAGKDAKPVKGMSNFGGTAYRFPVIYHLEDGRTLSTTDSCQLLRDAKKELASMPKEPKGLSARFNESGDFWGTMQSYHI